MKFYDKYGQKVSNFKVKFWDVSSWRSDQTFHKREFVVFDTIMQGNGVWHENIFDKEIVKSAVGKFPSLYRYTLDAFLLY